MRLRELRGDQTQKEFSEFVGISSQQTYANYETKRIPKVRILQRIAQRNGVRMEWLLNGSEPKFESPKEAVVMGAYEEAFKGLIATMTREELYQRLSQLVGNAEAGDDKAFVAAKCCFEALEEIDKKGS